MKKITHRLKKFLPLCFVVISTIKNVNQTLRVVSRGVHRSTSKQRHSRSRFISKNWASLPLPLPSKREPLSLPLLYCFSVLDWTIGIFLLLEHLLHLREVRLTWKSWLFDKRLMIMSSIWQLKIHITQKKYFSSTEDNNLVFFRIITI